MASFKPIHSLILDANPLIRNDPPISTLLAQSHKLYTIPAVIDEIRDAEARNRIQTTVLPFLTLRTPKPASVKHISDFARRTGDLEVLSRPDIQILALAYELECERNDGDWRLRNLPGQARTNGPMPEGLAEKHKKETEERDGEKAGGTKTETQIELEKVLKHDVGNDTSEVVSAGDAIVDTEKSTNKNEIVPPTNAAHVAIVEGLASSEPVTGTEDNDVSEATASLATTSISAETEPPSTAANSSEVSILEDDLSDSEGWITPSNLQAHIAADSTLPTTKITTPSAMQVATITTDYAMQNILLRTNLNLLAPSLQRIQILKTYILRCHACFATTPLMSRQFCHKCGGATLLRTSCSTDSNGVFKIHLKKNMQWNNRGNVFSIPKPTAGSSNGKRSIGGGQGHWGMGLILAEDQPEYQKLVTEEKRRKERDLMDEDYLPDLLSGGRRGPQGRIKVGAGRNVNSKKRR